MNEDHNQTSPTSPRSEVHQTGSPRAVRRFRHRPLELITDAESAATSVCRHLESIGGAFDLLGASTDANHLDATDLISVSAMGTPVPVAASLWLLSDEGQWLATEILSRIPVDADLSSCDPGVVHDLAALYHLLRRTESQIGDPSTRSSNAMGQATATRVMARKRPRLVPVSDSMIRGILGYRKDDDWWRRWRLELDNELMTAAAHIRRLAAIDDPRAEQLSDLRVLDISLRGG